MENQEKFAYFYDKANRTELFCTVTQAKNYGTAKTNAEKSARKLLPKKIEKFLILKAENVVPFGSFLSDTLSINFNEIMECVGSWKEETPWDNLDLFPVNISPLTAWGGVKCWKDVWEYAKKLYAIRKYIEACIERPRLYSFGLFQQLLSIIGKPAWHLQTLGFFAPVEVAATGRYFFNDVDKERLNAAFLGESFSSAKKLSDLDDCLEIDLLGWSGGDYLPSPALEGFEISNVVDAVLLSLFHLLQEQTAVKKCANCNKLFVPLARADAIYCDRPAPQDSKKTCKEYGSKVLWYEGIVNDDVAKLARNIYCSKQMLAKRNPDKPEYAEMFEYFKGEKKRWEQQVKAGIKTRDEFAEWLRAVKLCKTLGELERS